MNHSAVSINARRVARMACAQPSAGRLPHLQRARRSGGEAEDGSGRDATRRTSVSPARADTYALAARQGRRADGLEEELASRAEIPARARRQARPRRRPRTPGAARATPASASTTIIPTASVVVELGIAGSGHRHAHHDRAGRGGNVGPADGARSSCKIGDNKLPPSGGSGGSTTVGGVSASTRKSTVNALQKLFETVARRSLNVPADQLEAVDGAFR